MRLALWVFGIALFAMGASSRPSFALEPAGGPAEPTARELGQEPEDASAGDDPNAAEGSPGEVAGGNANRRSWLAQGSSETSAAGSKSTSSSSGFTLGAVLIVLGLGGAAIVVRQKRRKLAPLAASDSRLSVLSSSRIGPKAYAVTAHVNGRVLLLGVTDHAVTHLGWLDAPDPEAAPEAQASAEVVADRDELPDDYPGSALRGVSIRPAPLASSRDLQRFREVLRGAVSSRPEPARRPSYPSVSDAASTLAAQTTDVVSATQPGPTLSAAPASLRRKRQRRHDSLPAGTTPSAAPGADEASASGIEGQVAGLRALRNG